MTDTEIIETLRTKLAIPGGRHLYAVMGSYPQLAKFSTKLLQAKTADGEKFPKPVSVNNGILGAIPDQEFRKLVEDECVFQRKQTPVPIQSGHPFQLISDSCRSEATLWG